MVTDFTPAEQWQLHDYFRPVHGPAITELLLHRAAITAERPQLPHQAGKAYAKLLRAAAAWSAQLVATSHGAARGGRSARYIRVRSVVRPDIDKGALARAIIEMAKANLRAQIAAGRRPATPAPAPPTHSQPAASPHAAKTSAALSPDAPPASVDSLRIRLLTLTVWNWLDAESFEMLTATSVRRSQ